MIHARVAAARNTNIATGRLLSTVIPENFSVAKFIRDPVKQKVSRLFASSYKDDKCLLTFVFSGLAWAKLKLRFGVARSRARLYINILSKSTKYN
jgi:hypothetical protein